MKAFPRALFLLALFAGAARAEKDYELTPSTGNSTIEFYSDSFDYQKSSSIVVLKGQVEVFDSTWTMRAEQVVIDLTSQRAQASGRVQISDGKSVLLGQNGYFDFAARESYVEEASGGYPPWIFKGRFLRVRKSKFIYKHARFTSCAEENAHYHFTASRLTVFPDHYLLGSNIFLYLGPIPVFYLPVVYRSLSPKHLWVTRVRPGYDKRNGGQFQTATDFNLGPFAWTRLYLDYFQKEGIGSGLELNYRRNDRLKGTLYGYHIHETTSRKDRWTFLGNHWQQLSPIYSAQGRLQILSDPQFNNLYFRSNAFRIAPQLDNSAAIVRQTPQSTLRLSVSRLDMQNLAADRFERADEKIPRLDFQSAPFQLFGLTPLNSIQAFAEHATEVETATAAASSPDLFYRNAAGVSWTATRSYHLLRGVSFIPKIGYGELWKEKISTQPLPGQALAVSNVLIGRYLTNLRVRYGTRLGDWDLFHSFQRRLKANSFQHDDAADDYGVEENNVRLEHALRPNRQLLTRASLGYDLRNPRSRSSRPFEEHLQPLTAEMVYTPKKNFSLSIRDDYQISRENRSFIFQTDVGDIAEDHFGFGISQNAAYPGRIFLNQDFGWQPKSSRWHFNAVFRSELSGSGGLRLQHARFFEKEFLMHRTLHDFVARLAVRFRPGVKEVTASIDLKFNAETRNRIKKAVGELEWYPWRSSED